MTYFNSSMFTSSKDRCNVLSANSSANFFSWSALDSTDCSIARLLFQRVVPLASAAGQHVVADLLLCSVSPYQSVCTNLLAKLNR